MTGTAQAVKHLKNAAYMRWLMMLIHGEISLIRLNWKVVEFIRISNNED